MANIDFSGNQDEDLRAFVAQMGRQPNASEVAAYRDRFGGGSSSSGSGSAASAGAGSGAQVTTNVDLSVPDVPTYEPMDLSGIEYNPTSPDAADVERADSAIAGLEDMISGLREKNKDWLAGRISGDVADQLRSQSALSARSGGAGAGSPLARNLQARDFGLTSMQIQQQGMQQEGALAGLQQGLAGMREQRMQFMTQLREEQERYRGSFAMDKAKTGEASRQFGANLQDQMYRTQLAQRELLLKQEAFNAEQNFRLVELITNSTLAMMGQQVQAAGSDVDFGGNLTTFNDLQAKLERLLARSNAAAS